METNIQCHITQMPNIVKNLFLDKNVKNIYIENISKDMYRIETNVILRLTHVCNRCGHGKDGEWVQRGNTMPKRCPLCTSPYWNKPRMSKLHNKAVKGKKADKK